MKKLISKIKQVFRYNPVLWMGTLVFFLSVNLRVFNYGTEMEAEHLFAASIFLITVGLLIAE